MKKTALAIMILTLISKLLGFGREVVLSYYYGASYISDAYLISLTIPAVIFSFIGVAITTSYIPIYNKIAKEKNIEEADEFTSNLINFILVLCTIIVFLVLVFTGPIVKIFASGFEGNTLELTIYFTRITIFAIYITALTGIFNGYLHIKKSFVISALIGLPLNFFLILSIIFSDNYEYIALPLGKVLATVSQLLFILPTVIKKGFSYKIKLKYDTNIKLFLVLVVPVIIGFSVNQVNILIDRTLASQIIEGGISSLNYANRLNLFIKDVFIMSLVTVMYPTMSKLMLEDNIKGVKKMLTEGINFVLLISIPITIGVLIYSEQIITFFYGRGAFDLQAIQTTSKALLFYTIGITGLGLREILSRVFFSMQDTKTPTVNAIIGTIINIILNIILSKYMGISGLALATSLSALVMILLLFISLRMKIGSFSLQTISSTLTKILLASILMGAASYCLYFFLNLYFNSNVTLIFSIGFGAFVYFITVYSLKVDEVTVLVNQIMIKFRLK